MMDIEAIRQSPRQFVDLETVEQLSDAVMLLQMEIENLRKELAEVKEIEFPKKVQAVADRRKKKVNRLESELADLKASLGEPVAYLHHISDNNDREHYILDFEPTHGMSVHNGDVPLYALKKTK